MENEVFDLYDYPVIIVMLLKLFLEFFPLIDNREFQFKGQLWFENYQNVVINERITQTQ